MQVMFLEKVKHMHRVLPGLIPYVKLTLGRQDVDNKQIKAC